VYAAVFAVAAADWVSGSYLMAGCWWLRSRLQRRHAPESLADEVEAWLRSQA
jgi:hypothetical protein